MERDTLARAVQADDMIVVFMDEEQRKIFRESNGSIITSCIDQIYTIEGYSFFSVCVLDPQGEATPVCQAISANNYTLTAKIMLETMKLLEPSAVCSIHCLMTSVILENPFIEALSQTLPPNSVPIELSTYPLHPAFVETYEYIVQSSLKPFVSRLDQLIYSVFKMNEFLQCRRDRFACGFYGQMKSKVQQTFEALHETYEQTDSVRFEVAEVENNQNDSQENKGAENAVWEVSKFEADILLEGESHIVSAFPKGKTFCQDKTCEVICEKCVQLSFPDLKLSDKKQMIKHFNCAHALSCTCSEFNSKYNCIHIHIVSMHNNGPSIGSVSSDGKIRKMCKSEKLDHDYLHGQISERDKINLEGDVLCSEDIRPCTVKLKKLEDIDLNAALSTPIHKKKPGNESQDEEDDLLEEAVHKLSGALQFLKKIKENRAKLDGCGNTPETNGQRKSGRKRKMPLIRNICRNVVDFVDCSFPENCLKRPIGKHLRNATTTTTTSADVANNSNNKSIGTESKHRSVANESELSLQTKDDTKVKDASEQKEVTIHQQAHSHQLIGENSPRYNLLRVALNAPVSDFSWCALICGHYEKSLEMLANLEDFDIDEREIILEKFILAKSLWMCKKCKSFDSMDSMLSGYVVCKLCQHWFHRVCCDTSREDGQGQLDHAINEFVCENCVSLFFGEEVVQEHIQPCDENIASQGPVQFQAVTVGEAISASDGQEKIDILEASDVSSKLLPNEQIEIVQAQSVLEAKPLEGDQHQITPGSQIYYQLPPNISFPPSGEGHYVVQLQGNTVQQIGFEVI